MKRVVAKKTLIEFWRKHPDSEQYLKAWYEIARTSNWRSPADIKNTYARASILKSNRVVFNVKGNSYRLLVKFNYKRQWAFIRFIGTHNDYNKINVDEF